MTEELRTKIQKLIATVIALIIVGIAGILGINEDFVNTVSDTGEQTNSQNEQQIEFVAQEDLLIDFIDVHIPFVNYRWPAFNIADCGITVGVAIYILAAMAEEKTSSK